MSKVSEALEPWVYDPMYKGGDQPDQPHPEEGHTKNSDCCSSCDYWDEVLQEGSDSETRLPDPGSESLDGWFTPSGGDATKS
jgi:hypothetical protein